MKTTFKLLSLLSLTALAMAPFARAEDAPAAPPAPPAGEQHARPDRATMRANRLKMLDEHLHLTDAQKQQITGIWTDAEQKGRALRDDDSLSKEDRRAKMGEIMKTSHEQVRALLTPEQQIAFDALPPEPRGHRGPPKGDDAPPPPAEPKQ